MKSSSQGPMEMRVSEMEARYYPCTTFVFCLVIPSFQDLRGRSHTLHKIFVPDLNPMTVSSSSLIFIIRFVS